MQDFGLRGGGRVAGSPAESGLKKPCFIWLQRAGGGMSGLLLKAEPLDPYKRRFKSINNYRFSLLPLPSMGKNQFLDHFCTAKDLPYTLYGVPVRGRVS